VSFLIFGAAVSMGDGQILLIGTALVFPLYVFGNKIHFHGALLMLRRLKWLFASIFIIYLFFTPGQLLIPDVVWGPTHEGVGQGLFRIGVLVLLVATVNFLISSTERDEFLSGVLWCLRPFSFIGLPYERLAVRITLTFDEVSRLGTDHLYDNLNAQENQPASDRTIQGAMAIISRTASHLFLSAIIAAEARPVQEILLPEESSPPLVQWLVPTILIVLFTMMKHVEFGQYFYHFAGRPAG
jgi:hypothetical protein